jgi:hypothetical protein
MMYYIATDVLATISQRLSVCVCVCVCACVGVGVGVGVGVLYSG